MRKIFKHIILSCLILITVSSIAQEQKFIEIEATEEITLKPTSFVYEISLGESNSIFGMDFPLDDEEELAELPMQVSIKDISVKLDKEKFTYSVSQNDEYAISSNKKKEKIKVTLTSEAELKRLFNAFKDYEGISGKISHVEFESLSQHYDELYKKLYNQALNRANKLAKISGNTIGTLISASEVKDETGGYMDIYSKMLKEMPYNWLGLNETDGKTEQMSMMFKFELK